MRRATGRRVRRAAALALACSSTVLLSGCGKTQNTLAPASHQSADIASLFWWMMGGAWIGLALVVGLLVWSWRRGRRRAAAVPSSDERSERQSWYVVVGAGIALPIVVVATLFVISDIFVIRTTEAPADSATAMTIVVTGHQWWWEVQYPGTKAVAANEIHIPVRTPVRVEVRTADVIHSFSVPELNRTIDTIPGQTNSIELYADAVGRYRGQCREFCGLQHAHMALYVFADPPAVFRRWLANQARPARPPATALARAGERYFLSGPCSSCHTIRGTSAHGFVGPDLTHLATRTTLAALTIPNRPDYLAGWITHSQSVKPGNRMPDFTLTGREVDALVAYLDGLK
jgi:cytochrome c oxidase subunit II